MSNKPKKRRRNQQRKVVRFRLHLLLTTMRNMKAPMDNVIQLLNTQYNIAPPKNHDKEITPNLSISY